MKLNRADLKDYAQYEERTKMANLTHQISVFTESILNMETYLIVFFFLNICFLLILVSRVSLKLILKLFLKMVLEKKSLN